MKTSLIRIITCFSLIAGGCSNAVIEHAKQQPKIQESDHKNKAETKVQLPKKTKNTQEIVDSLSDEKVSKNKVALSLKEEYHNPNEFAVFVGDVLQRFYEGSLSPEQYYEFIQKYGSSTLKLLEPSKREEAVAVYTNVQEALKAKFPQGENYVLSTVEMGSTGIEGYFYRQWETPQETISYITTIVKEGNVWKFRSDQPSTPITITNTLNN